MVSDGEFASKTSKGKELDGKKAPGRTGAERTGKLRLRACYFVGCLVFSPFSSYILTSLLRLDHWQKKIDE